VPYADPEIERAYRRAYQLKHRERLAARARERYLANHEERKAKNRAYYAAHPQIRPDFSRNFRKRYPWKHLLNIAKHRADRKGVPFALTKDWARENWTGFCAITGLPFDLDKVGSGPGPNSPTIDRKDPKLGYVPENCFFVLACVNSFKHQGTEEDMYRVAVAIVNRLADKYST
jgi:hypothetical protein